MLTNPSSQIADTLKAQTLFFDEIVYLSLKFMHKALHWVMSRELRELCTKWACICLTRLNVYERQF
jgi:patatin-like phospholipase/acyl hydrolase